MLEGRRILLVEDEPLISMMLEDMLIEIGCVVAGSARDSSGAMGLLDGEPLDAAVLDVHLTDGDSFALADTLLARGVPVVFSTGVGRADIPDAYDAQPHLTKPFDVPQLQSALLQVLPRLAAE